MDRRTSVAALFAVTYATACVWALWSPLWATLLLAAASPAAAGFASAREGGGRPGRLFLGLLADAVMAGIAIVLPVVGDVFDAAVVLTAAAFMFRKTWRFVLEIPGGLACAVLYLFLWTERDFLPHPSFAPGIHHGWWFYPAVVIVSAAAGSAVIAVLAALTGTAGSRGYPMAVLRAVGYPWYFLLFALTFFVPDRRARQ